MPRTRYVWNPQTKQLEEVGSDWQPTHRHVGVTFTDRYMEGLRATDGTPIDNRTRRREYMRREGVADHSDFKETRAKAQAQREAFFTQGGDQAHHKRVKEQVARAYYQKFKP